MNEDLESERYGQDEARVHRHSRTSMHKRIRMSDVDAERFGWKDH
jgi:hypothetical protein